MLASLNARLSPTVVSMTTWGCECFVVWNNRGCGHATPLHKNDFLAIDDAMSALRTAEDLPEGTPLRRLRELVNVHVTHVDAESDSQAAQVQTADGPRPMGSDPIRKALIVIRFLRTSSLMTLRRNHC